MALRLEWSPASAPAHHSGISLGIVADAEGSPMHVRMVRYTTTADPHELIGRVESELLPIFEGMPGFKAYSVAASGEEVFSFSVWNSTEEAEAADQAATGWVAENIADDVTLIETNFGELLLSTTLGVSPARV
jgi:hypothetical protein